jgi:tetratricopeptide (TPR) repeat protein
MKYIDLINLLKAWNQDISFFTTEAPDSFEKIIEQGNLGAMPVEDVCSYVSALAAAEEWQRAEAVARLISDEEEQENTLFELAQALAGKNLLDKAEELTFSTDAHYPSSISEKIFTLNKIASSRLKNHQKEQAITILKKAEKALENYPTKDFTRAWMVDEMAEIWDQLEQKALALELWKKSATILAQMLKEARLTGHCDYESLNKASLYHSSIWAAQGI